MALESNFEREGMSKKVTVNKNTAKMVAAGLAGVLLVVLGVVGTLKYQSFINSVKAQGVAEYKQDKCENFNKDNASWLECEVKRAK
jgi:hypothetical protein|nr:MAG TPA: hypothetical protein [Caudoviricetes sp.]